MFVEFLQSNLSICCGTSHVLKTNNLHQTLFVAELSATVTNKLIILFL